MLILSVVIVNSVWLLSFYIKITKLGVAQEEAANYLC